MENDIPLLKINLRDDGINSENVAEQLISKGRTENEARERTGRQQWAIYTKFREEELCDYIITNTHDPKTGKWAIGKEELLDRFRSILEEFQLREKQKEDCLRMILPEGMELKKLRTRYEREKWNFESPCGYQWIDNQITERKLDPQTSQNLGREFRLQRWIDSVLMRPIDVRISGAINSSRQTIPDNDMEIRAELQEMYEERLQTLDNDEDGLCARCYEGLINMVPLFTGETVKKRIELLRSPYRDQNGPLFKADAEHLQRRLIQISDPNHYRE